MASGTDIQTPRRYRLADWLVEADLNRISCDGATISVEPQVIEVLCYLAARPGEVVSRDELLQEVWGGRAVTDDVLTRAVGQLRKALGDDPHEPRVIETIARRGYRLLAPVTPLREERLPPDRGFWRRRGTRVGLVTLALAIIALATGWALWRPGRAASPAVPTVTVLPFQMLSAAESGPPIDEGLVEVLVSDLSGIEGLSVIARESASSGALDGLSLKEIGALLDVDAVVQGSVQGDQHGLRVDMRLVRTRDGRVLWSDAVRGGLDDLLALHERAAARVAAAIRGGPPPVRNPAATTSRDAYREYLFGRHHWKRRTVDGFHKAITRFETALELDPRFAQAHAALAQTYVLLPFYGIASPREAMPRARLAAERALELDPRLASAHAVLGQILHEYEWDPLRAETAFERAIALDPGDSTARQWYVEFLLVRERLDESRRHIEKALELDPLSPIVGLLSAGPPLWEGHYEEAAKAIRRVLEIEPRFAQGRNLLGLSLLWSGHPDEAIVEFEAALPDLGVGLMGPRLGYAYAVLGRREDARALLREVLAEAQERYVSPYAIGCLYLGLGDTEAALTWLEKAYAERDGQLRYLNVDRRFDPLRKDPRFVDLHRRVGLPAVRRASSQLDQFDPSSQLH